VHSDERHLFKDNAKAALGDLAVIVGSHNLAIACVSFLTDLIQASHELCGVFRIAEFLKNVSKRRNASFFLLLVVGVKSPSIVLNLPETFLEQASLTFLNNWNGEIALSLSPNLNVLDDNLTEYLWEAYCKTCATACEC
jgi:hypothetical protein